jgi:hypothetical protein
MDPIHETEPVSPAPVQPRDNEPLHRNEKPSERPPEDRPLEPDTGKILDTYA